jgi:hypothetical protein
MYLYIKYLLLRFFFPNSLLAFEYRLFYMLNKERKRARLSKLFFQYDLRKVARLHSLDMAKKDYFSHTNLMRQTPKNRFEAARVSEVVAGENLAMVRGYKDCVKTAHVGLMNSPGHRANILSSSYNCVGIGASKSDNSTYYFTQNFSHRLIWIYSYPSRLILRRRAKVTFRVLDKKIENILFVLSDDDDKTISKQMVSVSGFGRRSIQIPILKRGVYTISIFAGTTSLVLVNQFSVHKRNILW